MNSEQAFSTITNLLSPHLSKTLLVMPNPMPEILEILKKLEKDSKSYTLHLSDIND
jgi:hypothetical protein